MGVALRAITRLQDGDDVDVSLGAGENGKGLRYDYDSGKFVLAADSGDFGVAGSDTIVTLASQDAVMNAKLYTAAETFYGVRDNLYGFVYNWGGPTTVQDADHPRWGWMLEHNYKTSAEGAVWDEFYLMWDDLTADPNVSLRPFMTIVNRDTAQATHAINGRVGFNKSDGTDNILEIVPNDTVGASGALLLADGTSIVAENNYSWLYQKDTDGTYRSLIYLTNADQYYVGNGILDIVLGATNVQCTKNLWVAGAYQSGNGTGVLAIKNASTNPDSAFGEGGILWVQAGALKYIGKDGTVTTLAPA